MQQRTLSARGRAYLQAVQEVLDGRWAIKSSRNGTSRAQLLLVQTALIRHWRAVLGLRRTETELQLCVCWLVGWLVG